MCKLNSSSLWPNEFPLLSFVNYITILKITWSSSLMLLSAFFPTISQLGLLLDSNSFPLNHTRLGWHYFSPSRLKPHLPTLLCCLWSVPAMLNSTHCCLMNHLNTFWARHTLPQRAYQSKVKILVSYFFPFHLKLSCNQSGLFIFPKCSAFPASWYAGVIPLPLMPLLTPSAHYAKSPY